MRVPRIGEIQSVFFDMDGLMFRSEDLYRDTLIEMGETRSREFTIDIHQMMMGKSALESIAVLKKAWDLQESLDDLLLERDQGVIRRTQEYVELMPGIKELISFCKERSVKHAIVTGSTREVAEHLVSVSGLENSFEFILDGSTVLHGKPAPDIYLKAIDLMSATASESLVFEDSMNGVLSAKAAGCRVVACPNEYSTELDFSIADLTVSSLSEVVSYLPFIS